MADKQKQVIDHVSIEDVATAIVREYLHGKGYNNTLSSIDNEAIRTKTAINSRMQLAKLLCMEKMLKKNKQEHKPLKTMLEILIKYILKHKKSKQSLPSFKPAAFENGEEEHLSTNPVSSNQVVPTAVPNEQPSGDKREDCSCEISHNALQTAPSTLDVFSDNFKNALKLTRSLASNVDVDNDKQQLGTNVCQIPALSMANGPSMTNSEIAMDENAMKKHNPALLATFDQFTERKPKTLEAASKVRGETGIQGLLSFDSRQRSRLISESGITLKTDGVKGSMKSSVHRMLPGRVRSGGLQTARNKPTSGRKENFLSGSAHHLVTSADNEEGGLKAFIHESNHSTFMDKYEDKYEANKIRDDVASLSCSSALLRSSNENGASGLSRETITKNEEMGNWLGKEPTISHLMKKSKNIKLPVVGKFVDVEVGDLDEVDERSSGLMVSPDPSHVWLTIPSGVLIDCDTAVGLKTLLLGNYKMNFSEEWKIQDFSLNKNSKVCYGIVQKKGGPCGVLACVQAYLIKELIFVKSWKSPQKCNYSEEECKKCLALALAHILWKCGGQQKASVAMPSNCQTLVDVLPSLSDGLIEKISILQFSDLPALQSFLNRHISWYTSDNRYACIAFLYSAILSRGIDEVKEDMDDPKTCLIAKNGYCSQEIVNLLLTGCATSNVFDNVITLDDGKESRSILKGITRRSEIGYLALFEHYNSCQVGTYLKSPRYPIWVICSESHFSVLFAKDLSVCEVSLNRAIELLKFDLFYYDGLFQQEDEIKLTVQISDTLMPEANHKDAMPPLDHCIRTKWKGASVDWNGTEPLL